MWPLLSNVFLFDAPWGKVLLTAHLLIAILTVGAVTHHWWVVAVRRQAESALRVRYACWMAAAYAASWLLGCFIYPAFNLAVRQTPVVGLDITAPWAVSLFEYKEHFGTFALFMLPWLVLAAARWDRLGRLERASYVASTWVFTIFVYAVVVCGTVVTAVRGMQ